MPNRGDVRDNVDVGATKLKKKCVPNTIIIRNKIYQYVYCIRIEVVKICVIIF